MKKWLLWVNGLLLLTMTVGCQTVPYSDYKKVQIGAEKGAVISLLGQPEHTYRKQDTDRWVYRFSDAPGADKAKPLDKEIWFQTGHVVYTDGDTPAKKIKAKPTDADFIPVN